LAKYPTHIRNVRKLAQLEILNILKNGPSTVKNITKIIQSKNKKICDDSITCDCSGRKNSSRPEWKHQIGWAVQDLKYVGEIKFNPNTREYSLNSKN